MAFPGAVPVLCYISPDSTRLSAVQQMLYLAGLRFHTRLIRKPWESPLQLPMVEVFVVEALPELEDTIALAVEVMHVAPECAVLLVADEITDNLAFAALSAEVRGLVTLDDLQRQLPSAVDVLAQGGYWIPRSLLLRFLESSLAVARRTRFALARAELEERDLVLLDEILNRYSDEQIAEKMRLSPEEVQVAVRRILTTFGVRRRDDLLLLAEQRVMAAQVD